MAVTFSQEVFDEICIRIGEGESLRAVCRDEDMPSTTAFMNWLNRDESGKLVEQYTRAMDMRADSVFDELMEIADTPFEGEKIKIDKDGNEEIQRGDMIEHRRLQVDARKWALARMAPKKYGDKLDLNHGGGVTINLPEGSDKV